MSQKACQLSVLDKKERRLLSCNFTHQDGTLFLARMRNPGFLGKIAVRMTEDNLLYTWGLFKHLPGSLLLFHCLVVRCGRAMGGPLQGP